MVFMELSPGLSVEEVEIPVFKTDIKAKKYIYLLSGTHGDEVEGVYVLQKYFEWLRSDDELEELPLIVIPILNVDGYKQGTIVNSHAVDLNSNYQTKDWSADFKKDKYNPGPSANSEPENQFLLKLFEKFEPGIVLSFHTWKPIINYNGQCKDIAEFIAKYNHYPISEDIGYPTPGSLGTYVPETYGTGVITFECPHFSEKLTLQDIWEQNEEPLKRLFTEGHLKNKLQ